LTEQPVSATPEPSVQAPPEPGGRAARDREPLVTLTRTTFGMQLMAGGFRFLFRAFARVRTSGLDDLPRSGPLIVVANHTSNIDPPLVAAWLQPALGRPLQFLAKEQLFVPVLRPILRMYGAIVVRAGGSDVEAYRAAVTVLRGGGVVSIFPEGTRSLDGVMREPHAGVALIAARSGATILPVGISGAHRFLPPRRTLPVYGTQMIIRVGEPFSIQLDPTLDRRAAIHAATDQIMGRIAALVDPDQRGRFAADGRG
jgi:1-acyl-sn-glycerol-3-phosphate acyltransferase